MKTMKHLIASLVVSLSVIASATEYTWTGSGTDAGNWKDPANWGTTIGYPVCGDIAIFNADATITSDLDMEGDVDTEDMLTINIASGITLTINGSFSGEGGISRTGDGTIKLNNSNPFKGEYQSVGSKSGQKYGRTYITNGGALGLKKANFHVNSYYASLYINAGGGTLTIAIPYSPTENNNAQNAGLYVENGTAIFSEPVNTMGRLDVQVTKTGSLHFAKKVTMASNSWFDVTSASGGTLWLEGGLKGTATFYLWGQAGDIHMGTSDNVFSCSLYGKLICENEDVFINNTQMVTLPFSYHQNNYTGSGTIDLNGYDQTFPVLTTSRVLSTTYKNEKYGFTSPIDKSAAYAKFSGAYKNDLMFNCYFNGKAGIEWNPATEHSFIITNSVSTTAGGIRVKSGTVELAGTASFTALTDLEVSDGATFKASAGSCDNFFATNITLAVGSKLKLAAGTKLQTRKLTVGDTVYTAPGDYTATIADFIEGDGEVEVVGEDCYWTGAKGGLWSNAANWSIGKVPDATSAVKIAAGQSVVIDETNPRVFSLLIGGGSTAATLVMTNWNTCLQAHSITVAAKGTITTGGAFENEADKSRVWIDCDTLTIDANGSIDMLAKGWSGGHFDLSESGTNPRGNYYNCDGIASGGWGPGRSMGSKCAPCHFGIGGNYGNHGMKEMGTVYDDPLNPTEPGSGGWGLTQSAYGQARSSITHGGGAVRIVASKAVVVNGTIDASGKNATSHSYYNSTDDARDSNHGGSGGSVYISCSTISGTGSILANGGDGTYSVYNRNFISAGDGAPVDAARDNTGLPGAGGGIAIYYDTAKQTAGACAGMTISAASGLFQSGDILTYGNVDKYRIASEPGTLKFSDTKIVDDTIGNGLSGRLFDLATYTYDGDLNWTAGWVRFGATGVVVTVTGDLTINGNSRLDIGGSFMETNHAAHVYLVAGDEPVKLAVGGDLTISDGAGLQITAAQMASADDWGGEVAVDGAFTVGEGGFVYPQSAYGCHGAPHFTAGSFTVDEGGLVDANRRGGSAGCHGTPYDEQRPAYRSFYVGIGLGGGKSYAGGSYGGLGGKCVNGNGVIASAKPGAVYGDEYCPRYPGSGGYSGGYGEGGDGGGLFYLEATGPVVVNGTISANGYWSDYASGAYMEYFGSGSGGGIYLIGTTFAGAATGVISARGGDSWCDRATQASGCGGGGRIALWFGADKAAIRHHRVRHATAKDDEILSGGFANWLGTTDVSGGTTRVFKTSSATVDPIEAALGSAGTVTYSGAFDGTGVYVIFR